MEMKELVKKIRLENNYSFSEMADKLGFSKGMVSAVESGRSPASQKFLEAMIKKFPLYKNNIIKSYTEQYLPEELKENILVGDFEFAEKDIKTFTIAVHNFDTRGNGRVETENYEEVKIMLSIEVGTIIQKNGYVVKILGEEAAPFFFPNDKIVFLKEKFDSWENYDRKIILVKLDREIYVKKLYFDNGTPFLHSFNERVYPRLEIKKENEVEFLGVLYKRIDQDLSNLKI